MADNTEFYTLKGYEQKEKNQFTASMEDYLEMICRLHQNNGVVRINELSEKLNVKSSSASKMVRNLKEAGYVDFEKYSYIQLTQKGLETGSYLLYRHDVLHRFLCLLNGTENELQQVEKIEHFINETTIHNLNKLCQHIESKNHSGSKQGLCPFEDA